MIETLTQFLKSQLENEFMTGGAVIVILTALLAYMRNVPTILWVFLQRRFIYTIDITDHDPAFYWIQQWLSAQDYTRKKAHLLTISTQTKPWDGKMMENHPILKGDGEKAKAPQIEVMFNPAPGLHLFRFKGRLLLLERNRREVENSHGRAFHETLTFKCAKRETVKQLVEEAQKLAFPPEEEHVAVYRARYHGWQIASKRAPRSMDSVILAGSITEELVQDAREFFSKSEWYKQHGIPYQRGYLLYGPPGNGKTSLAVALASMFKRDVYIAKASSTTDEYFHSLMNEVPAHGIVLIEDVDCLFHERTSQELLGMSYSGFINAIDGIAAPVGRVLILTTNHLEKLDAALIRSGRCDRKFNLGNSTPEQAQRLFARFFPGCDDLASKFGTAVGLSESEICMADLQEIIISNSESPEAALQVLEAGQHVS